MKSSPRFSPKEAVDLLKKYLLVDPSSMVIDFEKSHGPYLHDAVTGRDYLDFYTFHGSLPIGFNHPGMFASDFAEDVKRTGICKPANSDILSVEYAEFVDAFCRIALPDGFNHLFFVSGGALAVENALKTAFDWKVRKNLEKGTKDKGTQIVHFKKAFHGRSGYTLSLTNTFDLNKTKYFPTFPWPRITCPCLKFPLTEKNVEETIALEERAVREIKQAFADHAGDIAAIIIEPVQGEGGDNHFRKEFFQVLRTLADDNEALLIFDEVQTGMGTTGRMWCAEHFGVMPDIFCFGKKAQVGGIFCNERVQEVESVFKVPSRINSTFGGDLSDMVRARRYLEIIDGEKLVENAERMGRFLLDGLIDLSRRFEIMSNARGRGLMIAFDLPTDHERRIFHAQLMKEGCLTLPCGPRGIRLRPPLNLSREDAQRGLEMIGNGLRTLYGRPVAPETANPPFSSVGRE
ncbi:MAG: L-lysine 6-transaminase [Nitrospinae bacterium]|nr:L-lysine 6-transaminase [Nitrospinota bacterium]